VIVIPPLVRRVAAEHRRVLLGLGGALIVNVSVYALVVSPLSDQVANVEQREQAAERALTEARAEFARANGTLTGKDRASAELTTFYTTVLPPDLSGARRTTQLRLQQLARQVGLTFERDTYQPVEARDSTLTRLRISMVLSGSYADVRDFIHQLEIAKEFVVIDNVELAEGTDGEALAVTLELSTYFRTGP
jgi:Tfp pilus assembly protein PilO